MNFQQTLQQNHDHHDQVRNLTLSSVNRRLDDETEHRIHRLISMGPRAIRQRLEEIDKEWDIDRALMMNFSVVVFAQLLAAYRNNKRSWLALPLVQTSFLFMHAAFGWCPPTLLFRPLGFRTRKELQWERETLLNALKG